MWPSSQVPPCCCSVWCVAGLLSASRFVLLSAEADFSAVCSTVWSSRPHLQVGDGASFIFLNMWALSRLWPERSHMTMTCCPWPRKWKSSLSVSVRCLDPRAALMRVFFSWKVNTKCLILQLVRNKVYVVHNEHTFLSQVVK